MPSAPLLTGQVGSLIAILDACLLNGFGSRTLDSLVIAGGIATATISAGHTYNRWSVVEVAGASPAAINGQQRILSVTATTFTFAAWQLYADQTASGTITCRLPPIGSWEKTFSGTNKAAYRSIDPLAAGFFLRVNDTGAGPDVYAARVRGYESMSDVDTGTNPFPTVAQQGGEGGRWIKSSTLDATARPWWLVGDTRGFYLWTQPTAGVSALAWYPFGDVLEPFNDADVFATMIGYGRSTTSAGYVYQSPYSGALNSNGGIAFARSYTGVVGAMEPTTWHAGNDFNAQQLVGVANFGNPHPVDGRIWTKPIYLIETTLLPRGRLRGCLQPMHASSTIFPALATPVDYIVGATTKMLGGMGLRGYAGTQHEMLVDLDGGLW